MLAPSNDFGYSPAASHHGGYDPQQHQQQPHHVVHHHHERPKIYGLDSHPGMHGLIHHSNNGGLHDYGQLVHGTAQPHHQQHNMTTPQHHPSHHQGDFDHEPLMLSMHNPAAHYYPPMGQLLHVSADYQPQHQPQQIHSHGQQQGPASVANSTPSSGTKRSREDLNMKEKKRMFKLNDRINQLKDVLDEAGVQTKKNKQSILDNAAHYIEMLRSNLLIAKQKAERAEREAENFRQQSLKNSSSADKVVKGCFQKTTTPRVVVGLDLQPVTFNGAFLKHTGQTDAALKKKNALKTFLCANTEQLDRIVKRASEGKKSTSEIVEASTANGVAPVNLMVSVITDDKGKPSNVEFSLIPLEKNASDSMSIKQLKISKNISKKTSKVVNKGDEAPQGEQSDASASDVSEIPL